MSEKIIFSIVTREGTVTVPARDDAVTGFQVTECGALLVYLENTHARWNIAAYAPGEWRYVDRPEM